MSKSTIPSKADFLKNIPDPRPFMVTRQELPKLFPGMTARTWANLAHLKQGPKFYRKGKLAWYVVDDVIEYLTQNPIQTSNGV
jgi:hypothetical protein